MKASLKHFLVVAGVLLPGLSGAEVSESSEHGFIVSHTIATSAEPSVVYRTLTAHIDQWWNGEHSWSGDAANLYMDLKKGGCFCEKLPNGGRVEHLRLLYFSPGDELRFDGALGPLQTLPVSGRMIWKIEKTETGSQVHFVYKVFGSPAAGLAEIAPAVDRVIGEQLQRLGDRLEPR